MPVERRGIANAGPFLLVAVGRDVLSGGVVGVAGGMQTVGVGRVSVMRGLLMIARFVMTGGFAVMARRVFVMFGGVGVVAGCFV